MAGQLPIAKPTTLIVVWAFDRGADGELVPAFEPREMQSEHNARRLAATLAPYHQGVIAWSRHASPDSGEFGEPEVLFRNGDVPDLE